jgi:MFS family permease
MPATDLDLNRPATIAAACYLTATAFAPALLLPLLVGAAARQLELTPQQVGVAASSLLAGLILVMVSAVLWIRRSRWRRVGAAASIAATLCFLLVGQADSFSMLLGGLFLGGVSLGGIYAPSISALSDTRLPDRNFGYALFTQIILGAGLGFVSGGVSERWGLAGYATLMAAGTLSALLALPWFPDRGAPKKAPAASVAAVGARAPAYAGLAGMFLMSVGSVAVWAFFERIGAAYHFSAASIARVVSIGLVFSIPATLLAAFMGNRFGRILPLSAATLILVATYALVASSPSFSIYLLAGILIQSMWSFGQPFQFGAISSVDTSGRLIVLAPACQGTGGMVGPALAGMVLVGDNFWPVILLATVTSLLGLLLFVWLCRHQVAPTPPATTPSAA